MLNLLMLRNPVRMILCVCAAALALLVLSGSASAAPYMVSLMQDDDELVYIDPAGRGAALNRMRNLGVEAVRVTMLWEAIAPNITAKRKPRGFNGAKPGDYPNFAWDPYDDLVRKARDRGIEVNFNPTGPGPAWAHGRTRIRPAARAWRPSPRQYAKFVRAAGRRYSGSYRDENQSRDVLPRVEWWGIWNEPNQPGWLTPQGETKRGVGDVAAAPRIYRDLLVAGAKALLRTGHGDDLVLIGELAPIGSAVKPKGARASLRPGLFLREMFCLNGRFHAYTGREARARGCNKLDRLAVLERLPRLGVGHHAYTRRRAPTKRQPKRDMIDISNLGELTRTLDKIAARTGLLPPQMPVFLTEFGYQSLPPDPFRGVSLPLQAKYINEGDYIAWKNPRVFSSAQFLLYDSPARTEFPRDSQPYWATFQTGLITAFPDPEVKPALNAYKFPLIVKRRRGTARIWGQARFAPNGITYPVYLQARAPGSSTWTNAGPPVEVTHSQGFFRARRPTQRGTVWRAVWAEPDYERLEFSREAIAR
jgi:hypothetical protein